MKSLPSDNPHLCAICMRSTTLLQYNANLMGVRMRHFWFCPQCDFNRPLTIYKRMIAYGK